jgi:hypothetical protein
MTVRTTPASKPSRIALPDGDQNEREWTELACDPAACEAVTVICR